MLIIAISGWGQDDDRRQSREAGFDRHMVKPVDYRTLVELLGEHPTGSPAQISA
jgi:DNA-binding response OmpR family regulator